MQDGELGFPLSVQLGHAGPVTYLDFHPWLPTALLSAAFDGTCRLWDVSCTHPAIHVLQVICSLLHEQTSRVRMHVLHESFVTWCLTTCLQCSLS